MTKEPASKKPKLSVIDGQPRAVDTRPPVARFSRHTLPERLVAVRQFVADYGVVPNEELAPGAPSEPVVPAVERSRKWSKPLIFAFAMAVVIAGAVGLLHWSSPAVVVPPPRLQHTPPAPAASATPAPPPVTTVSPRVPTVEHLAQPKAPAPQRTPRQKGQERPARSAGDTMLGLDY